MRTCSLRYPVSMTLRRPMSRFRARWVADRASRRVATGAATCVLVVLLLLMAAATALPAGAAAHRVQRGIIDGSWMAPEQRDAIVTELSGGLHAQVVRVVVSWAQLEPRPGRYDEALLGAIRESLVVCLLYTSDAADDLL